MFVLLRIEIELVRQFVLISLILCMCTLRILLYSLDEIVIYGYLCKIFIIYVYCEALQGHKVRFKSSQLSKRKCERSKADRDWRGANTKFRWRARDRAWRTAKSEKEKSNTKWHHQNSNSKGMWLWNRNISTYPVYTTCATNNKTTSEKCELCVCVVLNQPKLPNTNWK